MASTAVGGGAGAELCYPTGLSDTETTAASERLSALPVEIAQQLLDELAARMRAGGIRLGPLAYLNGLIRRARAGNFRPAGAYCVAQARTQRRRGEEALEQRRAAAPPFVEINRTDPLIKRLEALRAKARYHQPRKDSSGNEIKGCRDK